MYESSVSCNICSCSFKEISKNINNSKLLIVGDGPDKEYLEDLVKDLKLKDKVIFTGKVPIEEIQEYYRLMNIFVTFSIASPLSFPKKEVLIEIIFFGASLLPS